MRDCKQLEVWRRAHRVVLTIYEVTRRFPSDERFGLTSQIRRAAVSIAANIAEGARRSSSRELLQFLNVAQGSRSEVQYFVQLAADLKYLDPARATELDGQLEEVGRMLHRFREAVTRSG